MNSWIESLACKAVKLFGACLCLLPAPWRVYKGRCLGLLGYYLLAKKRALVESNLKVAFGTTKSPAEIRRLAKNVFMNFACSFLDLLCLPKIKKLGFENTVILQGWQNVTQALSAGKGCILLGVHSGSWELASLVGSMCDYPYNIVANEQIKAPQLNDLLNDYRRLAGAKVISSGSATREIIRALQANEIVSLVLDQGGRDGTLVEFLGKTASVSTGAIRLGLKYQVPICPVWIERQAGGKHVLSVFASLDLQTSGDVEKDVELNTRQTVRFFEEFLRKNPSEYMWFYKVYKYSNQADVLIFDDGKTGHLRQSQALANILQSALQAADKQIRTKIIAIKFRIPLLQKILTFYCMVAQVLPFLRRRRVILKTCLKPESFGHLMAIKPDYIISCGSQTVGVNFMLSRLDGAKSIHILNPNPIHEEFFTLVVLPQHDVARSMSKARVVVTKTALNLISPAYLQQQKGKLLSRFSHLKSNVRPKIGVLLGGNTKGVAYEVHQIRLLIHQLKEAVMHFNMDILLTTSRRTPKKMDEMIVKELRHFPRCALLVIANDASVPEAVGGILALSDLLIVSGESISMISEAISSGKRTIVFSPTGRYNDRPANKYEHFVLNLSQEGYVLACSIKDMATSIEQALRQKISVKINDDENKILEAMQGIVA